MNAMGDGWMVLAGDPALYPFPRKLPFSGVRQTCFDVPIWDDLTLDTHLLAKVKCGRRLAKLVETDAQTTK